MELSHKLNEIIFALEKKFKRAKDKKGMKLVNELKIERIRMNNSFNDAIELLEKRNRSWWDKLIRG